MSEPAVPFAAVVVAAGSGTRFGADLPKALIALAGRPLVAHAVQQMAAAGAAQVVVVAPADYTEHFRQALAGLEVTAVVAGGRERTHSVRAGLAALDQHAVAARPSIVLVHDAARPLVPIEVTRAVIAAVAGGAVAVVPAVPVPDTIRELDDGGGSRMLERSRLRAVQTPQGFDRATLAESYRLLGEGVLTDDAGVCEAAGHPVTLVEGSIRSFKITYPADLAIAEQELAR